MSLKDKGCSKKIIPKFLKAIRRWSLRGEIDYGKKFSKDGATFGRRLCGSSESKNE